MDDTSPSASSSCTEMSTGGLSTVSTPTMALRLPTLGLASPTVELESDYIDESDTRSRRSAECSWQPYHRSLWGLDRPYHRDLATQQEQQEKKRRFVSSDVPSVKYSYPIEEPMRIKRRAVKHHQDQ
ncbi:hypothetical protein FOL47_006900 [Perkinsus chesapeaki]|uniref:Uncharacterized protein n=1 Tax=Perkinsus chesapeaki TaxID=330153 RepID=A7YXN7_PERCH|nr:unknown [Perkinsus chesapeaki]KAF4660949.1 hypothetical protein FOL47_006900 [Perkinsus chesapeaki]